ncbi:pheromone A receptor-domain-containing protein [Podospora didyma]|uniref:Pheromone A receptor-domain-containing protein n=1 Tax=Podospora didyma TaxID=330526 RepID=A0AAE0NAI0_9PEZI|nr:pheromone A receptor-domain-containing protein [Podospora didyma]
MSSSNNDTQDGYVKAYLSINALFGFTTTPDDRIGSGAPYTNPALQVNLFFRLFLGILGVFITITPARLLWRNGEFAATVFCTIAIILNIIYVINASIWRDNNVQTWWAGYGWCDLETYVYFALHTAFCACPLEIMRGLATKVALQRVTNLSTSERRRQQITSALAIFTAPVVQVILTYFIKLRRYNIFPLIGCTTIYDPDWVFLTFFVIPTVLFTVAASVMAAITFIRYWRIQKSTQDVLGNAVDSVTLARQMRVRRKLYFLTLSVLVIIMPLILVLFAFNLRLGGTWSIPYDYNRIHFGPDPFNMEFISFSTSEFMSTNELVINYVPALTGFAMFFTFGTTPEAINQYRRYLLAAGLGRFFPKLLEEYVSRPRQASSRSSNIWSHWYAWTRSLRGSRHGTRSSQISRKNSILPIWEQLSSSRSATSSHPGGSQVSTSRHQPAQHNPWPDLAESDGLSPPSQLTTTHQTRKPWLFRTILAPMPTSLLSSSIFSRAKKNGEKVPESQSQSTQPVMTMEPPHNPVTVAQASQSPTSEKLERRDDGMDWSRWCGCSGSGSGNLASSPRVNTRVWSSDDEENSQAGSGLSEKKEADATASGVVRIETHIESSNESVEEALV